MTRTTFAAFIVLASSIMVGSLFAGDIQPERLRCEYRENPLGIDAEQPRLSWIVVATKSDSRATQQTAYRIVVASTKERLSKQQGDLWDSSKILSDETNQIAYSGRKLTTGETCWWSVQTWDQAGQASPWSPAAFWTMGLLGEKGQNVRWIGPQPGETSTRDNPDRLEISQKLWASMEARKAELTPKPNRLPVLRREFDAAKPIRRAIVSVCGLGQYELRLNGGKVGDHVLDPGWTNYRKTCLYSTYDVTSQIRLGRNCFAVMFGNGMYHERGERFAKFIGSFGSPKMILLLKLEYEDGTVSHVASDDQWRMATSPITFSSIFGGEEYDARLDRPGWDLPGYDDSVWPRARIVEGPGGRLTAQSAPPVKVISSFTPKSVSEPSPGVFVYDLGQNFSGWPKITIRGRAGATVKITPAETLDAKGLADQRGSGGPCYFTYTLRGDGVETWHPQFSYYSFRYLQVEGAVPENMAGKSAADKPVLVKLEGDFLRGSANRVGVFSCSDDLFNRIYHLVDWAIGSNLQSILTDCPHREKLGWLEIAHLMGPSIHYNYDACSFYAKVAHDTTESQLPNGMVPTIAPEYAVFDGPFRDSPDWGSASVLIPWQVYHWYGDRRVLAECYPTMKRYVDYLTNRSQNHIVAHGLGDWGDYPNEKDHMGWAQLTPISVTDTAVYYQDAMALAESATVLGFADDAKRYTALAAEIRKAFNRAFFNPKNNRYADGTPIVPNEVRTEYNRALFDAKTNHYACGSETSQAIPIALGIVEPDRLEPAMANLIAEVRKFEYVTAGDVGHRFLLRALAENGRNDLIFNLHHRTTIPGYGWQIAQGLTTLAECWDGRAVASQNHCQMGHILEWFHADVLGIQCDPKTVAFKQIVIRPRVVGDLRWVRGHYDSIRGRIAVDWKIEDHRVTLKVAVPANTSATVFVPTTDPAKVLESSKPTAESAHVHAIGTIGDAAQYRVESGNYVFTAPWK